MTTQPLDTVESEVERIFAKCAREFYADIAKPLPPLPLPEVTPLPWDTTPFPSDVEL